jgi:hypothetical protein
MEVVLVSYQWAEVCSECSAGCPVHWSFGLVPMAPQQRSAEISVHLPYSGFYWAFWESGPGLNTRTSQLWCFSKGRQ